MIYIGVQIIDVNILCYNCTRSSVHLQRLCDCVLGSLYPVYSFCPFANQCFSQTRHRYCLSNCTDSFLNRCQVSILRSFLSILCFQSALTLIIVFIRLNIFDIQIDARHYYYCSVLLLVYVDQPILYVGCVLRLAEDSNYLWSGMLLYQDVRSRQLICSLTDVDVCFIYSCQGGYPAFHISTIRRLHITDALYHMK